MNNSATGKSVTYLSQKTIIFLFQLLQMKGLLNILCFYVTANSTWFLKLFINTICISAW